MYKILKLYFLYRSTSESFIINHYLESYVFTLRDATLWHICKHVIINLCYLLNITIMMICYNSYVLMTYDLHVIQDTAHFTYARAESIKAGTICFTKNTMFRASTGSSSITEALKAFAFCTIPECNKELFYCLLKQIPHPNTIIVCTVFSRSFTSDTLPSNSYYALIIIERTDKLLENPFTKT